MNWYLAKMVFRIICGDGNHTAQFDEQLRLILATSKEEAFHKAQLLGGKEEEIFFNRNQQLVQWQFISVSELYQLNELIDGAELYSRIEEKEHAEAYLHIIHKKAEQIRFGNTLEILNLA
jgi:CCR4-NOT transcriptional regulation complex NOT5 subunit